MKIRALFCSWALISSAGAQAQQQAQPSTPPPNLPPGLEQQQQLPPGLRRQPLPPGLQRRLLMTNEFGVVTNQFGLMTNEFGVVPNQFGIGLTNQFGAFTNAFALATNQFGTVVTNPFGMFTNQFGVGTFSNQFGFGTNAFGNSTNFGPPPPTGFGTNRVFGTNSLGGTNQAGFNIQDQAVSQFDRTLLIRIRAMVLPRLHTTAAWSPVHFVLNEGTVTLNGFIISIQQRQQILTTVQGVPGVANVVDNLQLVSQDMAMTEVDQALLVQIRQAVPLQPTPTAVSGPIFFVLQQGVVDVVGSVASVQEGERINTLVRQTPGVVQVVDALTIGIGVGSTAPTITPPAGP